MNAGLEVRGVFVEKQLTRFARLGFFSNDVNRSKNNDACVFHTEVACMNCRKQSAHLVYTETDSLVLLDIAARLAFSGGVEIDAFGRRVVNENVHVDEGLTI